MYPKPRVVNSVITDDLPIPQSYREVLDSPEREEWESAMLEEMGDQNDNATYELVPRGPGINPIKSTWVFVKKYNVDGSLPRFKARSCANV